jgi:hypothetical protein
VGVIIIALAIILKENFITLMYFDVQYLIATNLKVLIAHPKYPNNNSVELQKSALPAANNFLKFTNL